VADTPDPRSLLAAGWRAEELTWEGLQEQALGHAAAGQIAEAAARWAEALRLARAEFAKDDPRLAASLANHACGLRHGGGDAAASRLLDEALSVWDASGDWIAALAPDRRARSSLFHLRLESKHRGAYDRFTEERNAALAAEGRAALQALRDGKTGADLNLRLARWQKERPAGLTDTRKLLAAVLLIASA